MLNAQKEVLTGLWSFRNIDVGTLLTATAPWRLRLGTSVP